MKNLNTKRLLIIVSLIFCLWVIFVFVFWPKNGSYQLKNQVLVSVLFFIIFYIVPFFIILLVYALVIKKRLNKIILIFMSIAAVVLGTCVIKFEGRFSCEVKRFLNHVFIDDPDRCYYHPSCSGCF